MTHNPYCHDYWSRWSAVRETIRRRSARPGDVFRAIAMALACASSATDRAIGMRKESR